MHIQQFNNLKKIAAQFSSDYQLSSELYDRHVELIEAACGKKIELVDNEQSLPMSQKRKEKYD